MLGNIKTKLAVFLTCLALLCTVITGAVVMKQAQDVLVAERLAHFREISGYIDRNLAVGFFELPVSGGRGSTLQDSRRAALREMLNPAVEQAVQTHPGVSAVVFSRAENFVVAGAAGEGADGKAANPEEAFVLADFKNTSAARSNLVNKSTGRVLTYYYPIVRAGSNFGVIAVSQALADPAGLHYRLSATLIISTLLTVIAGLLGAYYISRQVLADVDNIKRWLERLQYDLTVPFPKVSGDLSEVASAIEEFSASLHTLQETSRSLAGSLYLDEALDNALDMVIRVFGAEYCALLLFDPTTQELRVHGSYGLSEEYVQAARVKLGESISGMVLLTGKPMSSSDLRWDYPKSLPQLVLVEGMLAQLSAPLRSRGKTIGVVNVYSPTTHMYSANEITLLCSLANQIALTLENAKLFEEMETKATTDRLTGLYNHKHLHEMLAAQLKTATEECPISLLLLDIDYFKTYNDSFGHQAGDKLLQTFAGILKDSVRPDDFVARYGGEEFAIILRDTPVRLAQEVAERIRGAVERFPFHGRECQMFGAITVSVGLAEFPKQADNSESLIKKADEALYKAKFTGRNRAEVYYSVLDELAVQLSEDEKGNLEAIKTMISVISAKDKYTFGHCERVMKYAQTLAKAAGLQQEQVNWIAYAAYLHDVGKIEVPSDLLTKPKSLTDQEWKIIIQHPVWSKKILQAVPSLKPAFDLVLSHHEWYNGQGYPRGLEGEAIPFGARIIAIADSYDAITSNRLFRKALPHREAVAELRRQAGTQFDPNLAELFEQIGIF